MRRSIAIEILLASVVLWGAPVRADGTETTPTRPTDTREPSALLFRGRPLTRCRDFLITEIGVRRIMGGMDPGGSGSAMSVDIGLMRNVSPSSAYGLSLYWGTYDEGNSSGFRARYRYWRPNGSGRARSPSVELGAGLLLTGSGPRRILYPCPLVSGSINFGDWVAFTTQLEWIRIAGSPSELRSTIGTQFGSYASLIWMAAVAVTAVCIAAAASSVGPWD